MNDKNKRATPVLDYKGQGINNPLDASDFASLEGIKRGVEALKAKRKAAAEAKAKK